MKIKHLDLSNTTPGTWAKANGASSMLLLPCILVSVTRSIFSEDYQIVIFILISSVLWGLVWEVSDKFDKSILPYKFENIPVLSFIFAIGFSFILYKHVWFGGLIILFAMGTSFVCAVLAVNPAKEN